MSQWDGKLGDTRAAKSISSAKPIDKCPYIYPYFTWFEDRSGNKRSTTGGDQSKGDPGHTSCEEGPEGGGTRRGTTGHSETRSVNGSFSYTMGPGVSVNNSNMTSSLFGEQNTLSGQSASHNRMMAGGGWAGDNTGKPPNGSKTSSSDTAQLAGMSGGDKGVMTGGQYAIGAREITLKSAGSTAIQSAKGSLSLGSKANFLAGSSDGVTAICGQGLSLAGKQQVAIGSLATMSLYSQTNVIWAPGGIYLNCFQGPTCADTNRKAGLKSPDAVPGVKLTE